ncbi:MAG: PH domain-containing protein [Anaerolineae bacterium]|jgi:hypothetical protein
MGYLEKVLGDNEKINYRTHQHFIVLLQKIMAALFATAVFVAVGLAVLLPEQNEDGNRIRFTVGLIALGSLILPAYIIAMARFAGHRGPELVSRIWRAALAGLLILAVALLMMFKPELNLVGTIALVLALFPLFDVVRIFADWLNERYIITNRRVMEVRGIINKHVRDSALEKVNDVELDQSVIGRILGYGTVQIITGSDIGVNMFRRISNPVRFKREMLNAKEHLHLDERPAPVEVPPEAATPSERKNITDLLVELAELRQRGILSEEEFQRKKQELLDRI